MTYPVTLQRTKGSAWNLILDRWVPKLKSPLTGETLSRMVDSIETDNTYGDSDMTKRMDHTTYPRKLRRKSIPELMYIAKDASEAARAMPEGPNVGYYLDEALYARQEIARRQNV